MGKDSKKKTNREKKNDPGMAVALTTVILFSVTFIAMIINVFLFQSKDRNVVYTNSYNHERMDIIKNMISRGTIYAADGSVLARSVEDDEGNEKREYPYGEIFAHPVGFCQKGVMGLERDMQPYLMSTGIGIPEQLGNAMDDKKNPGNDVYTTLEPKIQEAAFKSLGDKKGAIIVTEVKTGRILAMASTPCFDPNEIEENWDAVSKDAENSPLLNRASQGLYPPGSTFKILTAAEYIREHPKDWEDYAFKCTGKFTYGDESVNCFHGNIHGDVDLRTAFAKSCNSSFANIGTELDRKKFSKMLEDMNFNEKLPVEFESSVSRILWDEDMTDKEMLQTSIGQSITMMSPLHLNMITQAVANDGEMLCPYLTEKVEAANGQMIASYKVTGLGNVMTKSEAEVLQDLMREVVVSGTGDDLNGKPYTVAGKTGSAEISDSSTLSHAWFTGYAPAEDPEVVITVIIEKGGSGGAVAAPVAGEVLDAYFD
ncbi:MAG: penicillin-binding protein 2 [Lachnospiraceae bacterium]|nr:penicillin-binding protein 2 [Lachnospiraceae bacterium]